MNSQNSSEPVRLESNVTKIPSSCEKHGGYEASEYRMPWGGKTITSGCPSCAAERQAEIDRKAQEAEQRETRAKILRLFDRSGIPARFADRTLDSYAATEAGQRRALAIAQRFAEGFSESKGASMVFCGKPGTGKTHLACGIGRHLINKLWSVQFLTVLSAIRHIKDTYRRDSERTEQAAINDLLQPDLLILDEIGAQLGSEHEKMLMFEIINERYQQCRSTILISNLNADELTAFLGDRVMDRFRESGAVVAFDWASHRGQKAAA